jgi:hypothetical protein
MQTRRAPASRNGGLTRVDMIAAVLKRHRGLRLRELIAALGLESGPRGGSRGQDLGRVGFLAERIKSHRMGHYPLRSKLLTIWG